MKLEIAQIQSQDLVILLDFWTRHNLKPRSKSSLVAEWLDDGKIGGFMAKDLENDGKCVGYLFYYHAYSAASRVFPRLSDVYPPLNSQSEILQKLFDAWKQHAIREGHPKLIWESLPDSHESSLNFLKGTDTLEAEGFETYSIGGEAFRSLAARRPSSNGQNSIIRRYAWDGSQTDGPNLIAMAKELQVFLQLEADKFKTTREEIEEDIKRGKIECFMAYTTTGQPVGYLLFYWVYSLLTATADGGGDTVEKEYGLMEDLYIREAYRKSGVGSALWSTLAKECQRKGIQRIDWMVIRSNVSMNKFYHKLGAVNRHESEGIVDFKIKMIKS